MCFQDGLILPCEVSSTMNSSALTLSLLQAFVSNAYTVIELGSFIDWFTNQGLLLYSSYM